MATLTGTKIKDSYDGLLKAKDNDAIGVNKKVITDGLGNDTSLELSQTEAKVNGSLEVTTSATISGLSYPTSDGTAGQVISTDGAGNLTFADGGGGGSTISASTTTTATGAQTIPYPQEIVDAVVAEGRPLWLEISVVIQDVFSGENWDYARKIAYYVYPVGTNLDGFADGSYDLSGSNFGPNEVANQNYNITSAIIFTSGPQLIVDTMGQGSNDNTVYAKFTLHI